MTLSDLTQRTSEWLRGVGPMHDVVISSRVRLARNLAGMPFLRKCTPPQQQEITDRLREVILSANLAEGVFYVDVAAAGTLDRALLAERHLISRQHADAKHPRGVVISGDETVSIMINEEDHVRMQVLRSGMQMHDAFEKINRIDDQLEQRVDFAFSDRYGYLTACPTNVGTGLRVSVMLHLPALRLTGELDKAVHAARDMRLAIRGLYGEGTDAKGDFFQISNQITLGRAEEDIVEEFLTQIVPEILNYERKAREALLKHNRVEIDDKIFRALALLRSARRLASEEMMALLSLLRLGINLQRIDGIDLKTVNELFLLGQPAHVQKIHALRGGQEGPAATLPADERDEIRAEFLRRRLTEP
ncbi:MAG: protein arginine kinase [Phycisphaerae bacterium]|nr:protein arginine kinase [Phycisphaerae bacterium]